MRNLYYNLVLKFLVDMNTKALIPIIVAGDKYQGIYEFSDANTRFLTLADRIHVNNFVRLDFKTSYRVTPQIAMFSNKHIIGYDRIISGNINDKASSIKYIICDKGDDKLVKFIVDEITKKLKLGY